MQLSLEFLKVLCMSLTLLYATYTDIKEREVTPILWIISGSIGGLLSLMEFLFDPDPLRILAILLSIIIAFTVGFTFSYLGLLGGADFLAFLVVSIYHPWKPLLIKPLFDVMPLFIPSFIIYSSLSSSLLAIYFLSSNLLFKRTKLLKQGGNFWRKILVLMIGKPIKMKDFMNSKFMYPLEEIKVLPGKGVLRRFRVTVDVNEPIEEKVEDIRRMVERGLLSPDDYIWVTPGLPMMVFMLIGYFLAIYLGDLFIVLFISVLK